MSPKIFRHGLNCCSPFRADRDRHSAGQPHGASYGHETVIQGGHGYHRGTRDATQQPKEMAMLDSLSSAHEPRSSPRATERRFAGSVFSPLPEYSFSQKSSQIVAGEAGFRVWSIDEGGD